MRSKSAILAPILLVLCGILLAQGAEFPVDIQRCHVADTTCIVRSAMAVARTFGKSGYPSAGFPIIEPFKLARFDISDGRQGSLSLKLKFRDLNVEGLSSVQLDRAVGFERDPAKSKFEFHGSFPKITLRGKYMADGRILILPIKGDGDADITLVKPKFSVKFKPALEVRSDGKTYMSIDKLKVLVTPEKMLIKLTNLFNGDQALGSHLNQFLNENWSDVWGELQPSVQLAIAEVARTVFSAVFSRFAYEDIYLEN